MNKNVILLFAIFLVTVLAMGTVSAVNLENHDFDGYFSMDVPKDITFEKEDASIDENDFEASMITYMSNNLAIMYTDTLVSENSSYYLYQEAFQSANPDLTKCYESQEDNLRILEPTSSDDFHFALVGTSSGNKIVMIMGNDVNLLKEIGHSIEFNE